MPTSTGLAAQLSIGEETTYGTAVPASRGYEFDSEAIKANVKKVYGKSLRTLRLQRSDRTRTYVQGAAGQVKMAVLTEGMGLLFKHMLGGVVSTQPDVVNKPTEWLHSFTQSDTGLFGKSLTLQVGRPDVNGVVLPFTYSGVKVTDWTLSTKVGEVLELDLTLDAKAEDTATALVASPTYPASAELLTFIDGTVTVDGVQHYVTAASVMGKNGIKVDRCGLANQKREPVPDAEVPITGSFDADLEDGTLHGKFVLGTTVALVLNFSWGVIDVGKANPYQVVVTLPVCEITGDPPTVAGPQVVAHNVKFKALYNGTAPIITIDYHTNDTTP